MLCQESFKSVDWVKIRGKPTIQKIQAPKYVQKKRLNTWLD